MLQQMAMDIEILIPDGIPDSMGSVIKRCVEKDEAKRFRDAVDVLRSLDKMRMKSDHFDAVIEQNRIATKITPKDRSTSKYLSFSPKVFTFILIISLMILSGITVFVVLHLIDDEEQPPPVDRHFPPPKRHNPPPPPPFLRLRCADQRIDVGGGCCYPQQAWIASESRCAGTPLCPPGAIIRGESCYLLASAHSARSRQCFAGDSNACENLGQTFEAKERGTFSDVALFFYVKGCSQQHAISCYSAGRLQVTDNPVFPIDQEMALIYFEKSCDLGKSSGCASAGASIIKYAIGDQSASHIQKGKGMLSKSCGKNNMFSCEILAEFYIKDTPYQNKDEAKRLYQHCAKSIPGCQKALTRIFKIDH